MKIEIETDIPKELAEEILKSIETLITKAPAAPIGMALIICTEEATGGFAIGDVNPVGIVTCAARMAKDILEMSPPVAEKEGFTVAKEATC